MKLYGYSPDSLNHLSYTKFGRPYLDNSRIDFNISHSGDYVVCAVTTHGRIGIDIEKIKPIDLFDFERYMTPQEWNAIRDSVEPYHTFYSYWTKKEIENFHPSVRYDLTSKLYAQTGALLTKDYDRAINNRETYYLGLGYDLIATPQYLLTLFLSGGHEDFEYQEMVTINYMPPGILRNSVYYGDQRFRWGITENIAFNEKFEFVGNVEEGSRYRWTLNLGIDFKITPYLALRLDYEQKYFNFQPEVYGMDVLQKRDQKQGIMVMVSF